MSKRKTYLGDSVYADYDGQFIILTTENGGTRPSNTILLEASVFEALLYFDRKVSKLGPKQKETRTD